jgi:hypothetical protein
VPSHYELRVSESIDAPLGTVRAFLSDLTNFSKWNPFLAMDPNTAVEVSQQPVGIGATYSWSSKRIGSGIMTITCISETVIDIHMRFTSRNKREDSVQWILAETATGTELTWLMFGKRSSAERVFIALMRLDKVMSKHFADGLKQLKAALRN